MLDGNDVVYLDGHRGVSVLQALLAVGMTTEVILRNLPPPRAVILRSFALGIDLSLSTLLAFLAVVVRGVEDQIAARHYSAASWGSPRHRTTPAPLPNPRHPPCLLRGWGVLDQAA